LERLREALPGFFLNVTLPLSLLFLSSFCFLLMEMSHDLMDGFFFLSLYNAWNILLRILYLQNECEAGRLAVFFTSGDGSCFCLSASLGGVFGEYTRGS
jgi:hypothetical protein